MHRTSRRPDTIINLLALLALCLAPMAAGAAHAAEVAIELEAAGLEDLGAGWAYEGWLIVDGAPVTTGTFKIDGGGAL